MLKDFTAAAQNFSAPQTEERAQYPFFRATAPPTECFPDWRGGDSSHAEIMR